MHLTDSHLEKLGMRGDKVKRVVLTLHVQGISFGGSTDFGLGFMGGGARTCAKFSLLTSPAELHIYCKQSISCIYC